MTQTFANATCSTSPVAQLRAYWEGLRPEGGLPQRAQIDPRGIESALSATFLIERVAPGIARFRIAGMDLADFMGMEVRGLPFSSLFSPAARPGLSTSLETLFQSPAILTMDMVAERGIGRPMLTARLLVMPLFDDLGRLTMGLGCMALSGNVGRSPRRFDVTGTTLTRLDRPTTPIARIPGFTPTVHQAETRQGFAQAAAQFDAPKAKTAAPYLRLVE
ncbi:PAS domain-containing protein [Pseudorhodobacter antarcticus]|jgi:hypothetical protein|uniref:PAS domain-containing protein n=1 Tax=Pseudorhodobacter antarcticus TaxID=1077947 RepID=A0A1H8BTW9_9RHOB|nr:PAS domain-containing protein [Pseudorhodobacter antarcticus]SEM86039.1 PAS domain-containing protein [Pseudorhodobacter antarcticus]